MSVEDNYQITSKFSEQTHDFLSSHTIAPTPENYVVIYLYRAKNAGRNRCFCA